MNVTETSSLPPASARLALLARRFARILEVTAGVLALAVLYASWETTYTDQSRFFGGDSGTPKIPGSFKFAQFLQNSVGTLAWIALVCAAGFALEIVALRATRPAEPAHDPFAPDRAVQAEDTSPVIPRVGAVAIPTIVARREAPITVDTVDHSVWRR